MTNVTCDIVKDLLPLYVDGVVSEDSRKLVNEHLESCSKCKEYHKKLISSDVPVEKAADDIAAIKKIRRKINTKKAIVGCVAALLVAALGFGLFYNFTVRESYLSYEDSGIFVENDVIKSKNSYHCNYMFDTPDGTNMFMFLTTTKYDSSHSEIMEMEGIEIMNMAAMAPLVETDDNGNVKEIAPPSTLYYIPEEYAEKMKEVGFWSEGDNTEKVNEIISVSTLVWKAK